MIGELKRNKQRIGTKILENREEENSSKIGEQRKDFPPQKITKADENYDHIFHMNCMRWLMSPFLKERIP